MYFETKRLFLISSPSQNSWSLGCNNPVSLLILTNPRDFKKLKLILFLFLKIHHTTASFLALVLLCLDLDTQLPIFSSSVNTRPKRVHSPFVASNWFFELLQICWCRFTSNLFSCGILNRPFKSLLLPSNYSMNFSACDMNKFFW